MGLGGKSKLQQQLDQAWGAYRKELYTRRLTYARQGFKRYREMRIADAVTSYETYIRILEEWFQLPENGLTTKVFDPKKDANELLTIAAVYWDLAKVYDRTRSDEKLKRMIFYLDKYVQFSMGMPHEGLSLETVRKYVQNDKPVHKAPFKAVYKRMGGGNCFVTYALLDYLDPNTVPRLRVYRDNVLSPSLAGNLFVRAYYAGLGRALAQLIEHCPTKFKRLIADRLNNWAQKLPGKITF